MAAVAGAVVEGYRAVVMLPMVVFWMMQATVVCTSQDINVMGILPFTGGIWDAGLSMRVGMEILLEEYGPDFCTPPPPRPGSAGTWPGSGS